MDYYQCLQTFCDVVELGSFSKTAKKRYLSPSAISKQIDWLESRIKTLLITRNTRQLIITPEGKKLYQLSKNFLEDFKLLQQELSCEKKEVAGLLKITAPVNFGEYVIANWINEFIAKHNKIKIDFICTNTVLDLLTNEIDFAIRTYHLKDSNYLCEKMADIHTGIFAAPHYLEKHGIPKTPEDLANHKCLVHKEVQEPLNWPFKNDKKIRVCPWYQCSSTTMLTEAAKAGLGLIHTSHYRTQRHIKDGSLVEVLAKHAPLPFSMYLCSPNQKNPPGKVKAFYEFLKEKFKTAAFQSQL